MPLRRHSKTAKYFTQTIAPSVSIDMVYISGSTFLMGSPDDEEDRQPSEGPQHPVTVPDFFMGKYPVTQAQWQAVVDRTQSIKRDLKSSPSHFKGNDNLPVESVSWLDAEEFCLRLSKLGDREYRLPSEAQWEYACRAGTSTPFHFGNTISADIANYRAQDCKIGDSSYSGKYGQGSLGEFREKTTPVGSFKLANQFGLYDMHGNIWEWCLDDWHNDYKTAPIDGSAWTNVDETKNSLKVLRGGSWSNIPWDCRSASRDRNSSDDRINEVGFRLCSPARILP
ncbi:MAG: formylglycine-generating enzyme family protein [Alkalinema sp. RU_4_3]|nr:formylglycine-generating enzyme family protein [Alkalinema sp. RU_4_3]